MSDEDSDRTCDICDRRTGTQHLEWREVCQTCIDKALADVVPDPREAEIARLTSDLAAAVAAKEAAEREQYLDRCRGNVQQERAEAAEAERDALRADMARLEAVGNQALRCLAGERDALRERLAKVEAAAREYLAAQRRGHHRECGLFRKEAVCSCLLIDASRALASLLAAHAKPSGEERPGTCATCGGSGRSDVFAWLAEERVSPPRYAMKPRPGWPVEMSADPLNAQRFATKDEALAFICGTYARAFLPPMEAIEHGFMGGPCPACTKPGDASRGEERDRG